MTHPNKNNHKGFALLEALIAIVVLAIGVLALAKFQTNVVQSNAEAKARTEALNLAQKKIEELRRFATEAEYNSGARLANTYTVNNIAGTNATYTMTTTITNAVGGSYKNVKVVVSWPDRKNVTQNAELNSIIAKTDVVEAGELLAGPPGGTGGTPSGNGSTPAGTDGGTSGGTTGGTPSGTDGGTTTTTSGCPNIYVEGNIHETPSANLDYGLLSVKIVELVADKGAERTGMELACTVTPVSGKGEVTGYYQCPATSCDAFVKVKITTTQSKITFTPDAQYTQSKETQKDKNFSADKTN